MIARWKRPFVLLLILALCPIATKTANAGIAYASNGKTAGVLIALVAVGVLIGVGVYVAVHHGHSIKGCASSGPGGMQILNEGDQQIYGLTGEVDRIKAGDRVGLSGNKKKADKTFVVSRLAKDYGPCKGQTVTP